MSASSRDPQRRDRPLSEPASAVGARVRMMEGDADVRDVKAIYLRYEGFNVAVAEDGLTGLAYAQQHQVDIVILDLTMPRIDGLEVTRQLRAHDRTRHLPIIMFSGGSGKTTDAQDAMAAGP